MTITRDEPIDPSLFVEFFGDYPFIRVLDFLLEYDVFDYSKKDIARNANVSWNTMETFWSQLEEMKIVISTRKVGKATLYKLNKENPVVQQLLELDKRLLKMSFDKIQPERKKVSVKVAADSD
jgi:DNA-binding transcriptional ArsR family regulator